MNYNTMMRDCARYIEHHWDEDINGQKLGQIFSYTDKYLSYLFSTYYNKPLDLYLEDVKKEKAGVAAEPKEERERKKLKADEVEVRYQCMEPFVLASSPIVKSEKDIYDPVSIVANRYQDLYEKGNIGHTESYISIWWHDDSYTMEPYEAFFCKNIEFVPEDKMPINVPGSEYAIFSLKNGEEQSLSEITKQLTNYVYGSWIPANDDKYNRFGYEFHCYEEGKVYFFLPILEEEKQRPREDVYSIEIWTKYIDEHINMNLTTTSLAQQFHYSETHFKRIFRYYYKMSVADYIRKRKLQAAAEQIRDGVKCAEVARRFNFKTYAGFARAFQKEFNMTPTEYSSNDFEVIDLAQYYREYKDSLIVTMLEIKDIKMIGHSVIEADGDDADLPAQVCYWLNRDFPCLENTRFSCNKERREEKIALWFHISEKENVEYILGPVVEDFDEDIPEEMIPVTVKGGKYAMFESNKPSDKDDLAETLRMFTRCAFYGWIKEHEDMVDLSRITFERYIDNKIYLYVPIK